MMIDPDDPYTPTVLRGGAAPPPQPTPAPPAATPPPAPPVTTPPPPHMRSTAASAAPSPAPQHPATGTASPSTPPKAKNGSSSGGWLLGLILIVAVVAGGLYLNNEGDVKKVCSTVGARYDLFSTRWSAATTETDKDLAIASFTLSDVKVPHGPWTFLNRDLEKELDNLKWGVALRDESISSRYYSFRAKCPR